MQVNSVINDFIINSKVRYSDAIIEDIVRFSKKNSKPYIETRRITEANKQLASYDIKHMQNGDTFELYQTPYAGVQVYKDKNNNIKKVMFKDLRDHKKNQVIDKAIDSIKSAIEHIDKDFFKGA